MPTLWQNFIATCAKNTNAARLPGWFSAARALFPQTCLLCGLEQTDTLCRDCERQFFGHQTARCSCCALPLTNPATHCGQCLAQVPAFSRTVVACDYAAPLDQLVLALKFGHQLGIAPVLARQIALAMATLPAHEMPQLLLPVPLSQERLAQRGFNQAVEIGRPLAKLLGLPFNAQLLRRTRDTAAQSLLHPRQRQDNIRAAFALNEHELATIAGCHIGVIDDVITTGATLQEIAACLTRHGAQRVSNLVFARTLPH